MDLLSTANASASASPSASTHASDKVTSWLTPVLITILTLVLLAIAYQLYKKIQGHWSRGVTRPRDAAARRYNINSQDLSDVAILSFGGSLGATQAIQARIKQRDIELRRLKEEEDVQFAIAMSLSEAETRPQLNNEDDRPPVLIFGTTPLEVNDTGAGIKL